MELAKQLLVGSSPENYGQFSYGDYEMSEYTGLKDKNGTEIYEGDIVDDIGTICEVVFGWGEDNEMYRQSYGWCLKEKSAELPQIFGGDAEDVKEVEVIGNIYENPELLQSA